MSPSYKKKLLELIADLQEFTFIYFEVEEGQSNVSQERTNEQLLFLSKIQYLVGYAEAMKEEHEAQQ